MKESNDSIDWETIIISLHAYTLSIVKSKGWFRGSNSKTFIGGKEVTDYVYEAIGRYLKNPEKFDSSKGSLINYLKYNVIRSLVSNDLTSAENRNSSDYTFKNESIEKEDRDYKQLIEPLIETFFDEVIDYKNIIESVQNDIRGDIILEKIFNGLTYENLKRREIIEYHQLSEKDFDNGMRRLKTILKKTVKKFNLNNQYE
jgi:hypothetical protein